MMADFDQVARYSRHNGHPADVRLRAVVRQLRRRDGRLLASAINQNVTSWRSAPAATTIEHQVIEWMKEIVGFDPTRRGRAAERRLVREFRRPGRGASRQHGHRSQPARRRRAAGQAAHLHVRDDAHVDCRRRRRCSGSARTRSSRCRWTATFGWTSRALPSQIASDRAAGFHPVCVVATAGDVNTGAIDPLDAIADVCARQRVWLHVDGSYGAFAARSPHVGGAMSALGRADSLSLDPHKWLFAPLDAGCLLVREPRRCGGRFRRRRLHRRDRRSRHVGVRVLGSRPRAVAPVSRAEDLVPAEGARRARDSSRDRRQHRGGAAAGGGRRRQRRLRALAPAPLSIVCFSAATGTLGDDAFNKRLMVEVQRDGEAYLSNAMIGGGFALRACIVNFRRSASAIRVLKLTMQARSAKRPLMVAFDRYESPSRWTSTISRLLNSSGPPALREGPRVAEADDAQRRRRHQLEVGALVDDRARDAAPPRCCRRSRPESRARRAP